VCFELNLSAIKERFLLVFVQAVRAIFKEEAMKYGFLFVILLLTSIFSGCSFKPSDDEIKENIEALLSGCEYLSLDSFEKINGIKDGDNRYIVHIKYTLSVKPIPEVKLKIDNLTYADHVALVELVDMPDKHKAILEMGIYTKEQLDAEYNKASEAYNNLKSDISNRLGTIKPALQYGMACPSINEMIYNRLDEHAIVDFSKEFKLVSEDEIRMIKSENGWIIR